MLLYGSSLTVGAQVIIAHPDIPVDSMTLNTARSLFAGRVRYWSNGTPIKIFVFKDENPKHKKFCKEHIDLFPRQLRRSWERLIFSGMSDGPTLVGTEAEMIELIKATPGALGYVINPDGVEEYVIPIE